MELIILDLKSLSCFKCNQLIKFFFFINRGKLLFGYSDHELQEKGGYDLIHPDDLTYYAAAHQECKYLPLYHLLQQTRFKI